MGKLESVEYGATGISSISSRSWSPPHAGPGSLIIVTLSIHCRRAKARLTQLKNIAMLAFTSRVKPHRMSLRHDICRVRLRPHYIANQDQLQLVSSKPWSNQGLTELYVTDFDYESVKISPDYVRGFVSYVTAAATSQPVPFAF